MSFLTRAVLPLAAVSALVCLSPAADAQKSAPPTAPTKATAAVISIPTIFGQKEAAAAKLLGTKQGEATYKKGPLTIYVFTNAKKGNRIHRIDVESETPFATPQEALQAIGIDLKNRKPTEGGENGKVWLGKTGYKGIGYINVLRRPIAGKRAWIEISVADSIKSIGDLG